MGNNQSIRKLNETSFQYIPGLVRLEMPDCSLARIENGAIQKIPRIQVIVLARNKLSRWENASEVGVVRNMKSSAETCIYRSFFALLIKFRFDSYTVL